jgi:hypothetical protein
VFVRQVRNRRIVVIAMTAVLYAVAASTAAADPTYTVMNAAGGIYWRSAADWNTPEAIAGFGVYNGTTIAIHCYQSGTSVPGSADTMWEQATDVAGPGYGSGWLNEHFINDGQPINQPSPGVPPCNAPPPPPPPPPPPSSGGLVFTIFNAEGGIYYRNSPHWADTSATPGVGVYNGDQVELICGGFGDAVGPYNDTAWSYVNNLSRSVGDGWVNEHYINDGAVADQFATGEPMCGSNIPGASGGSGSSQSSGSGSSGSGQSSSPPSGVSFDRGAAVAWAKAHARDWPGYPAACTWFVSHALWAGGLPQTSSWTSAGSHGSHWKRSWRPGTPAAWAVPDFVSYIMGAFPKSTLRQLTFSPKTNSVPDAQEGDVIVYDWYGHSSVFAWAYMQHVALVVGFDKNHGPRVAEWGTNGTKPTPYPSRFWTWSKLRGEWLQEEYHGKVQAFLLHIVSQ